MMIHDRVKEKLFEIYFQVLYRYVFFVGNEISV